MKIGNLISLLIMKVFLVCGIPMAIADETSALILPGRCIGKVCIDDTKKIVRAALGMPSLKKNLAKAYEVEIWRSSKSKSAEHLFIVYYRGSVIDIHVTSDRFKTSDGISTLKRYGQARTTYPHGEEVEYTIFRSSHNRVDWVVREQGITFTAAGDIAGPIIRIAVHRVGKEKTIGYSEGDEWYWYPEK